MEHPSQSRDGQRTERGARGNAPTAISTSPYRVQLNADFTFNDALAIVPYLAALGFGALYTSPFFTATPGSSHGYDVTDYHQINPEIGSEDDLRALVGALRAHGMGLVADVVPNHMGIARGANAWWQDVLENGRTSPYAEFFDIDWRPLKEELRGKILLPVLGDHYGIVLERGELRLVFADGAFAIDYFGTPFPIAPPTYPMILAAVLDEFDATAADPSEEADTLPGDDLHRLELQSVITAFARLPAQDERDPERVTERRREGTVAKRRLGDLVAAVPEIAQALARTVDTLNGDPADPRSFDALDRLLEAQSYRLSSFRTAGEEINYRRFFAINELAGIRQEAPGVFAASHDLLLRLVGEGAVTGLRIDHPDGLWDPAGYFRELQRAVWLVRQGERAEAETIDWAAVEPALPAGWPGEADGAELLSRLPIYMVAEKILEPGEALPDDWALHGSVGYEFARLATGLFINAANQKPLNDFFIRFTGERRPFEAIAYDAKNLMLRTALASETNVLARALNRLSEENRRSRDFTLNALRHALREVIAGFPVYRTYITSREAGGGRREAGERGEEAEGGRREAEDGVEQSSSRGVEQEQMAEDSLPPSASRLPPSASRLSPSARDRRAIERAVALARRRNPASDPSVFAFLAGILLLRQDANPTTETLAPRPLDPSTSRLPDSPTPDSRLPTHFVMKFQQLTGPVMAKGVEDTALYIDNRLLALNEVGGDPARFGVSVDEFHQENAARARRWPANLLTSSTHDTKRSEDVRARIAVLSEIPDAWRTAVRRWARFNRRHTTRLAGEPAPDRNDEYRFYQTVLGVWPWAQDAADEELIGRIEAFMVKAAREAQVHTSWVNVNEEYEDALRRFVRGALDPSAVNPFLDDLAGLCEVVAHAGAFNALAQQVLKLTAPGVPDLYQGTEVWNQRLVDPDNRAPVDYAALSGLLGQLQARQPGPQLARELLASKTDGRLKLYLTARALAFRAAHPDLFLYGDYLPLAAEGPAAGHVVAFARRHGEEEAIVAVPRLLAGLTGQRPIDPIGEDVWGDTILVIPDVAPGTRYRDCFTGETVGVQWGGGGGVLPMAEVFATLPFAVLERTA